MGFQCLPQITGLVRTHPALNVKHRSNGGKILEEFGRERYSKSVTLDRTRSQYNAYDGYDGFGFRCWSDMCQCAEDYRTKVTFKSGKRKGETVYRSLREDAVIGWAMIINPPYEVTKNWDEATFKRFYEDSFACMSEIEPRLFREENVRMSAVHRDEGFNVHDQHKHIAGISQDANGHFCGNLLDAALCVRINEQFPKLMRARNWEIDDPDRTDFRRMGTDPAYKAERQAKAQGGQSVNRHIAGKKKKAEQELQAAREAAEAILSDARREAREIRQKAIQDASRDAQRVSQAILDKAKAEALEIDKKKRRSTAKDDITARRSAEADLILGDVTRNSDEFEKK